MKINEDFLPLVISPTEPVGNDRKRVWKQYKSELLISSNSTETLNGLRIVRSINGTITINGTASASSYIVIRGSQNKYKFNLDCNYILKGCPSGGDYTNLYSLYIDIDGGTKIKDEGNGGFFTPNSRYGEIYIVIRSGYTANNLTFTPQLIANGKEYILNDNNVYEEFTPQNKIYSTEEVRVGTWIDGKPLYRKVYTGTKVSGSVSTIRLSDLNIDYVNFYGFITGNQGGPDGTYEFPINYYENSDTFIRANIHRKYMNLTIVSAKSPYCNGDYKIVVEYTKTTD